MKSDNERLIQLLGRVLGKNPGPDREQFLEEIGHADPDLAGQLRSLLATQDGAGEVLQPTVEDKTPRPAVASGLTIDRYRLLEKIGEGGWGEVFVAEQYEPVRRRVALKVIKLGMDTRQVVARFEAERQALAMMDHPNIAKVLDGGATDTGRPFFVMELIRGVKITEYCDQVNMNTQDRLQLFISVCQAVQHAHQKGIIHRDLKPSNILVTMHDGVPVPKVIDFGIAKATEGRLTDRTVYTQLHQFVGTPAYMSPEQAEMSGLDVDTRSDIYSLGVLLYELLTGGPPFDPKELLQAGLDEMRRTIRQKEPQRPSTRLAAMPQEQQTTTAKRRSLEAPRLIHLLEGDLDWIVLKCLEKDRTRRYDSAGSLAFDLQRHLSDQPVHARPPSTTYVLAKTIRRNSLVCLASAAVLLTLICGMSFSLWQAARARREAIRAQDAEKRSEQRLRESEAIVRFLTEVFESPDPTRDGRSITIAEKLDSARKELETELADQPETKALLQSTLGKTYHGLGLYAESVELEEKALDYYRNRYGNKHASTIKAMSNLAWTYGALWRPAEALELAEQAAALGREVLGTEHSETIWALNALSSTYSNLGRTREALALSEEVLTLRRKLLGPEHHDTLGAFNNFAYDTYLAGDFEKALVLFEELLTLRLKVDGPEHPDTLKALENLANCYAACGREEEALRSREEVLSVRRKVLGPEHPDTLISMFNLVLSWIEHGRAEEAIGLGQESVSLCQKVLGAEHPDTLSAMHNLAMAYARAGRNDQALDLGQQVLSLREKVNGRDHPDTLRARFNLVILLSASGDLKRAVTEGERALDAHRRALGAEDSVTLSVMDQLASLYIQSDRRADATRLYEEIVGIQRRLNRLDDPGALRAMSALSVKLFQDGRMREAVDLLQEQLTVTTNQWGIDSPQSLQVLNQLSVALVSSGRTSEAAEVSERALAVSRRLHGDNHAETLSAMHDYVLACITMGRAVKAANVAEQLHALTLKRSSPEHRESVKSAALLGVVYRATGRREDLERLVFPLLAARKARLNPELGVFPRRPETPANCLDLSQAYNAGLHEAWHNLEDAGNNLSLCPSGLQVINGVSYDIRGIVQLLGSELALIQPEYPERVVDIPVNLEVQGLHFLCGTGWVLSNPDGTEQVQEIARYLIRYADGQIATVPVRYVEDVRNWQFSQETELTEKGGAAPALKVPQERWREHWPGQGVRLYAISWLNPRPKVRIDGIDFVSAMTASAPFLLAVTADTADQLPETSE